MDILEEFWVPVGVVVELDRVAESSDGVFSLSKFERVLISAWGEGTVVDSKLNINSVSIIFFVVFLQYG